MELLQELAISLFAVDSIWSVVVRGVVWTIVSILILIATDQADSSQSGSIKSILGFFIMFVIVSTSLIYLLFGFAPS